MIMEAQNGSIEIAATASILKAPSGINTSREDAVLRGFKLQMDDLALRLLARRLR